jgi:PAS domain S-box-containing protein
MREEHEKALKVAAVYAVYGGIWIFVTDRLVAGTLDDPALHTRLQNWKGWFFVLVTALLGYVLTRRALVDRTVLGRELRGSEERFRFVYENADAGIAIADADGRLLEVNPGFCELLGYRREELLGTLDLDLTHPDDRGIAASAFRSLVDGPSSTIATEKRYLRKDGGSLWVDVRIALVRDSPRGVVRLVLVVHDITERRRAQDEIHEVNSILEQKVADRTAELADANRELASFSYSVSHDLKAPLRVIDGYAQMLSEDLADRLVPEEVETFRQLRLAVQRSHALIGDILAYSRMDRRSMEVETVSLDATVTQVLEEFKAELDRAGAVVHAVRSGLEVRVDREGLAMTVRNLLGNAVKFSRDASPPTISIAASSRADRVLLTVDDNGIGFDMAYHDRIFEIFQRLERSDEYPGTGVGLALVRKAVQRMGGRVWAEGRPGKGATFFVELPC